MNLLLLGVGQTARALVNALDDADSPLKRASFAGVYGTTRSAAGISKLTDLNIQPLVLTQPECGAALARLSEGALVLVSFPPEDASDSLMAANISGAAKIVYISSTGVYGQTSGQINEDSPVDPAQSKRLDAEKIWLAKGAVVLRAPGLYSSVDGILQRLKSGQYRLPGDGSNYISRIHLYDLAQIIMAAFLKAKKGALYVAGDDRPATHLEVVQWLCQKYRLPLPPSVPLSEVHQTLRGNRQIDNSRVLRELEITLRYPTFVEGYSA